MAVLSHSPDRFQLINLAYGQGGKGPYMVRQEGYPSGSMTLKNERYYLLKDGSWMLNYAFLLLEEKEQEHHFFNDLKEVFDTIDSLAGKKIVAHSDLPEGTTPESILASVRKTGNRIIQRIQEAKAGRLDRSQA